MCDRIMTELKDPLVIQPAALELATIRKKPEDELVSNDKWRFPRLVHLCRSTVYVMSCITKTNITIQLRRYTQVDNIMKSLK